MKHTLHLAPRRLLLRSAQRGLSLLFALLALAAMSLAAVALVRSVDTGALVLGNLGFKLEATTAADNAAEEARALLASGAFDLNTDSPANAYYATSQDNLDPTGRLTSSAKPMAVINWLEADSCACLAKSPATCSACSINSSDEKPYGNAKARFVITRLCPTTGAMSDTNACAQPAKNEISNAANRGSLDPNNQRFNTVVASPYYRIIVRSVGPRGTVSFTETILH